MDRPLQILHLEDDLYDVELIQETLEEEGVPCMIAHVSDRAEYLLALEQADIDVILADFALPAFNGMEALALAQEKRPDVPFIFVSGAMGEEIAIESLKQGATDYVLKHRLSRLAPAIHRALREVQERLHRQQAEEQLRQSRDQLEAILSGITEGITVQLPSGVLIYANETAAKIAGYPSVQAMLQAPIAEFTQKLEFSDEWDRPFPYELLPGRLALQGQKPDEVLVRLRYPTSHDERWLVINATPIFDKQGQVQFAVSIFRDVTERTRLYEAERMARAEATRLNAELEQRVRQRTAQVRRLASELITSEQTVRQRIAQTLHDNLQQTLYATKMQLQFLSEEIGQKEELDDLIRMMDQSLDLTRQLTVELSPPVLEGKGLREALVWLAGHMWELYGLRVSVKAGDDLDTASEEQRVLLYQIVRELLFNVVKHAGVQEAEVFLREEDGGLAVIVSDHGQGFAVAALPGQARGGFGLRSVHERLQLFDGRAEIDSQPGAGTRVHLFLPQVHTPKRGRIEA